jgi:thymidylate synthase
MTTQYRDLLVKIRTQGTLHEDRTGTGTTRIFGHQMRFDLSEGFPLLTTKKMWWKGIVEELLWMLSGSTNNKDLNARGVHIWDEWATKEQCAKFGREEGDLGPVYGHQFRNFGAGERADYEEAMGRHEMVSRHYLDDGVDQIANILDLLVQNPNSRRIILSGWNPKEATEVALPPCHTLTQFVVRDGKLSAQMYQRSADVFLGVPFNIASYALLTHMLAHVTGLGVGEFIHVFGDVHIYRNHEEQVSEQIRRIPRKLPKLSIDFVPHRGDGTMLTPLEALLEIDRHDLKLEGYDPHPKIEAEVSV